MGNHASVFHTSRSPGSPQAACLGWFPCGLKSAPSALTQHSWTLLSHSLSIWTANLVVRMALGAILRGQSRHTLLCTVHLFCIQERKSSVKLFPNRHVAYCQAQRRRMALCIYIGTRNMQWLLLYLLYLTCCCTIHVLCTQLLLLTRDATLKIQYCFLLTALFIRK